MYGFTGLGNFEEAVKGGGSFAMDRGTAFNLAWRKTYLGIADGANSKEEGAADLRISSAGTEREHVHPNMELIPVEFQKDALKASAIWSSSVTG